MLTAVEGIYRNGVIELLEKVSLPEEARVVVTAMPPASGLVDLQTRGITREEAAKLRGQFETFAEDWERPEMDVYDAL